VTVDGQAKLIDFDFVSGENFAAFTMQGLGTQLYAPREVRTRNPKTRAFDVFSLARSVECVIRGCEPQEVEVESWDTLAVEAPIKEVLRAALCDDPSLRTQSVTQFCADFQRAWQAVEDEWPTRELQTECLVRDAAETTSPAEAERRTREESEQRTREEAEQRTREEAEQRTREAVDAGLRAEAERLAREDARRHARVVEAQAREEERRRLQAADAHARRHTRHRPQAAQIDGDVDKRVDDGRNGASPVPEFAGEPVSTEIPAPPWRMAWALPGEDAPAAVASRRRSGPAWLARTGVFDLAYVVLMVVVGGYHGLWSFTANGLFVLAALLMGGLAVLSLIYKSCKGVYAVFRRDA